VTGKGEVSYCCNFRKAFERFDKEKVCFCCWKPVEGEKKCDNGVKSKP